MPVDHPYIIAQLEDIKANVAEERRIGEASWTEVFTEGKLRNLSRVLLGAGPYLFNQWSGINSLAYFLPITFERNIGLSRQLSLILAGVLGIQYFAVSWLYVTPSQILLWYANAAPDHTSSWIASVAGVSSSLLPQLALSA